MPQGMDHVLSDLRVLDFTRALAGPSCTRMLAEMNATLPALVDKGLDAVRSYKIRVRSYVEKYGAWSLFVVSLLPPPAPFKLFVATAGLLHLPYRKFVVALLAGRTVRYAGEGWLAVRYGQQAWEWMIRSGPVLFGIVLAAAVLLFLTRKLRRKAPVVGS